MNKRMLFVLSFVLGAMMISAQGHYTMVINQDCAKDGKDYNPELRDGREIVDLGLPSGNKWAKYDIGATPTTPYSYKTGKKYMWAVIDNVLMFDYTKNNTVAQQLPPEADVTVKEWGGYWCMPTKEDFEELVRYCRFDKIGYDNTGNVIYYKVTSRIVGYSNQFMYIGGYQALNSGSYNYYGPWCSTTCLSSGLYVPSYFSAGSKALTEAKNDYYNAGTYNNKAAVHVVRPVWKEPGSHNKVEMVFE